jgi:hypothetical protein
MKFRDLFLVCAVISAFGVFAITKDDNRKPQSVPKKNGIVCAQDVSMRGVEERINGKLGSGSETTLTLANQFGSISGGKVTGMTVNLAPDNKSPTGFTYIVCAAIAGN